MDDKRFLINEHKVADGYNKVNGRNHGFKHKSVWVLSVRLDSLAEAEDLKSIIKEDIYPDKDKGES